MTAIIISLAIVAATITAVSIFAMTVDAIGRKTGWGEYGDE